MPAGRIGRRQFVKTSVVASLAAANAGAAPPPEPKPAAPAVLPERVQPVVIASANGNGFKNGGPRTCVAEAFERITRGEDVLRALIAGVNIVELDPLDDSVGYGGLPNADGVVQLDASCMHGPSGRAGAVAALEGVRTPSLVAQAVAEQTDHHLLVGAGAQAFARQLGFRIEDDLNTEHSRRLWLEWKRRIDPEHWLDPDKRGAAGQAARDEMVRLGLLHVEHAYGTINCNGINAKGELAGVTTTSGLAWKIAGRAGDSPILGAGLYVDGEVGAAGSTGRGEANLAGLSSFFIVEQLRRGASPKDAAMEALKRVRARTAKRLLDERGLPKFQLKFYVLDRRGGWCGAALRGGPSANFALCTEKGPETREAEVLIPEPLAW
jgi:N4-(beta-N-acetylglucosaminyl)-L-asparaginase